MQKNYNDNDRHQASSHQGNAAGSKWNTASTMNSLDTVGNSNDVVHVNERYNGDTIVREAIVDPFY